MSQTTLALLIDDDADDRMFFEMAASEMDFPVECRFAKDCPEGLHLLEDKCFTPDFIFVDINMPRMNGFECLEKIKQIDRLKSVPVYLYSTSNDQRTAERCIKLGGCGLIKKETSLGALRKSIQSVMENHKHTSS